MSVQLVVDLIACGAGLVSILDYFGVKPKPRAEGGKLSLNRKWKLVIMLTLVGISLAMSGYSFYRHYKPKIVERIIEKQVPVEKVVEKLVPQECPKPSAEPVKRKAPKRASEPPSPTQQLKIDVPVTQQSSGPCSPNQIGNSNVNNCGPIQRELTPAQKDGLEKFGQGFPATIAMMSVSESEPLDYAEEIREALAKHGKVGAGITRGLDWQKFPKGILIAINPDNPSARDNAILLIEKFKSLGLSPSWTYSHNAKPGEVMIIVGVQ